VLAYPLLRRLTDAHSALLHLSRSNTASARHRGATNGGAVGEQRRMDRRPASQACHLSSLELCVISTRRGKYARSGASGLRQQYGVALAGRQ